MILDIIDIIITSLLGVGGICAGFWLKKRDKKYNESLEKFKNELLKENRIFEDNYLVINEIIEKIKKCELYLHKIDSLTFLLHYNEKDYSEDDYANTLDSFVNECNNIEVIAQTKISFLEDELVSKYPTDKQRIIEELIVLS